MPKVFPIATLILFATFLAYTSAQENGVVEGPPRDLKLADKVFKAGTVVDGHFSIMEFDRQPAKKRARIEGGNHQVGRKVNLFAEVNLWALVISVELES